MAEEAEEKLDVAAEVERLNEALELQYRTALLYTLYSGSLFGFEYQALGDRFREFGRDALDDARMLVEKVTALEGEPAVAVAEMRWFDDPARAVDWIIEVESEAVDTLQRAIEPTGREGRSEAIEHMLEHLILRKQDQVDFLLRTRRTPA